MATVCEILKKKGGDVFAVPASASVLEAVHYMNEHRIGAVVITEEGEPRGIFTERDVLRRVVEEQRRPSEIQVSEVMTRQVICCAPETSLEEASRILKDRRIRHLPVCSGENRILGIVSIGDLNAYHASEQEATIHFLHDFIYAR